MFGCYKPRIASMLIFSESLYFSLRVGLEAQTLFFQKYVVLVVNSKSCGQFEPDQVYTYMI